MMHVMTIEEAKRIIAGKNRRSIPQRAASFISNRIDRVVDRAVLATGNLTFLAVERAARGLKPVLTDSVMGFALSGKKGETLIVREWPEEWFLPEKLVVVEAGPDKQAREQAQDTVLTGAFVGMTNLFPTSPCEGSGLHCSAFNSKVPGPVLTWRPCRQGQSISFAVTFAQDCTWHGTLFGKLDSKGLLRRWPWSLLA